MLIGARLYSVAAWFDRSLTSERLKVYTLIISGGIITAVVLSIALPQQFATNNVDRTVDFLVFYNAGKLVNEGRGADVYNYRLIATTIFDQIGNPPLPLATLPDRYPDWPAFAYSPPITLLLALIARLPYVVALIMWLALSVAALLFALHLLSRILPYMQRTPYWLIVLLSFCFWPLDISFINGQTTAFNLLLLSGAFYLSRPGYLNYDWAAGLLTAILALEKPQFVIGLALIWLLARRWRVLVWLGLGVGVAFALSLLLLPAAMFPSWLDSLAMFSSYGTNVNNANSAVTLRMTMLTYLPLPSSVTMVLYYAFFLLALLALGWAVVRVQHSTLGTERGYAWVYLLAIFFGLVTPAHLVYYDLALMLLPILLLLGLYDQPHERDHINLKLATLLLGVALAIIYPLLGQGLRLAPLIVIAYIGYAAYLFILDIRQPRLALDTA